MKYDKPIEEIDIKKNGKVWVEVKFENGVIWRPRLWEIGAIISGIGIAENIKYPTGEGYKMTKRFIDQCWNKTREEIYELSLSQEFDPNGIMQSRYREKQCKICSAWFDGEGEICGLCDAANKGWEANGK